MFSGPKPHKSRYALNEWAGTVVGLPEWDVALALRNMGGKHNVETLVESRPYLVLLTLTHFYASGAVHDLAWFKRKVRKAYGPALCCSIERHVDPKRHPVIAMALYFFRAIWVERPERRSSGPNNR